MLVFRAPVVVGVALSACLLCGSAASAEPRDPLAEARDLHVAGKWREALAAYGEVTAAGEPADAAVAFNNSCVIFNRLAEYPAALEACGEALALRRNLDEPRALGRTLNNQGLALQRLGRYPEARLAYREALEINERLGDLEAQLINRQNLGLTASEAGRYGEALKIFDDAQALARLHGDESWAADEDRLARLNRGVVLEKLGAYREALEIYRRLAEEREAVSDDLWAPIQVNLGVMYRNLGDPVRAVEAFEQAAAAYERLGDTAALSNATLNLALAWHLNLGRLDDAEAAYRKALDLARNSGDRAEEIQDLFYLGRFLLDLGRPMDAEITFQECLEASETTGSPEGRWSALYGLARVAIERGQPRDALEKLELAINEIETVRGGLADGEHRSGYFGDKRPVFASAVRLLAKLEVETPNAGHGSRGLEIVQQTKARELIESLGKAGRKGFATAALTADELESLTGDDVLIEYFVGPDRLYRWAVQDGEIRFDDLGPSGSILGAALETHRDLSAGRVLPPRTLETLARGLLAGLETAIAEAARVWIAPDSALHYLPFEILPLPLDGAAPLIEQSEIAYLPSGSALRMLRQHRRPADLALAGFGDPVLRSAGVDSLSGRFASRFGLLPLPAAARELAEIGKLLGSTSEISTGDLATEEAFRHAAARGARIFHLATHTVVDERPGQGAAILLTPSGDDDGLLRPAEIAVLDLRCELTVLAACRSALGGVEDGRAFASLTGSFLTAGSSAVLASLWDVGDEASAAFMSQLYYQLGRGHSPASALRLAKLRLRADPAWDRPDLWAAFILIGDAPGRTPRRTIPRWAWIAAALAALAGVWKWLRPGKSAIEPPSSTRPRPPTRSRR